MKTPNTRRLQSDIHPGSKERGRIINDRTKIRTRATEMTGALKADFQSSYEAPRNSLRMLASN
jgi:hypothetical protein